MKKFEVRSLLAVLLAAMMLFAFVACDEGSETLPPDTVDTTDPTVTEAPETDPAETEPVETDPPATEPADTKPAETEPAETDPPATEPVETKPAETEPAETECAHKFGAGKVTIPTCQADGYTEYTCTKCGETKKEDVKPKVDHLYVNKTLVAATCSEAGKTADVCSYCGDTKNEQTVAAYGHVESVEIIDAISFTHHKMQVSICKFCSFNYGAKPVQGAEHVFKSVELVPDQKDHTGLDAFGYELFECEGCDYLLKVSSNSADGHFYEARESDGKLACRCGAIAPSGFTPNKNANAGPVIFAD